ncbi:substance-K receptor-like [Stylophora pistillata]|uniref:substance-K receptor-like n=1 Tax=Stylophora pistillata TaxID=50429 RepID=UPI000C04FD45|nr:substance-K receptor-like [Stylophora pistillata]
MLSSENSPYRQKLKGRVAARKLDKPEACESLPILDVFGNGVVIYIICTRRRLHVETNYFMVSLASADLLVGLFLPTFIIITTYFVFFNLFTLTSIENLFVMTADRYISIVHPLRYQ